MTPENSRARAADPARLGAAHGYADALDRLAWTLAEAERAASVAGLAPEDAAYVTARRDTLRRIAAGLEQREREMRA